ncbi:MAG: virginiamycin B lyase family protein [Burkholderiales bacterium]
MRRAIPVMLFLAAALPGAFAGGSNYAIAPGALSHFQNKVAEWPVPTPEFARDPAPGPDGNIYVAVMHGNKIARFNTQTRKFNEWELPAGASPHGLLVDREGTVWYTGNGNGTIGRLDPRTGKVTQYEVPAGGDPHTLVTDDRGTIWFTMQGANKIGQLDMKTGRIVEYRTSGRPYGIALDQAGNVWFCRIGSGQLGRLDPKRGTIADIDLGAGTAPRRMATAPDGALWVTLYGNGKLIVLDPPSAKITKEYALPAGSDGGPYAVTIDGAGIVWVNEISTDTVVRLEPKTGEMRVVNLPSKGVGIRKMIVDARGRLWYMGSHNGRLGVVE